MFRLKVCGITCIEDALLAQETGVEAIGLIFCSSPRQVTMEQARKITSHLSPGICKIGVFRNPAPEEVRVIVQECRLDLVQLHGDESAAWADGLGIPYIKGVTAGNSAEGWCNSSATALLIDNGQGGTGSCFNWELFQDYRRLGKPLVLAGGLNPENVRAAIGSCRPDAVDVGSGVELRPGRKDPVKLQRFVTAVRTAFQELQETEDDPSWQSEVG